MKPKNVKQKKTISSKKEFFLLHPMDTRKANLYSINYQHDLFMPIKEPLDANSRETIRERRNNLYTERGRPVKIHRFLIRVLELFLGNLDDFKKYS
jgi:hypothetical protein